MYNSEQACAQSTMSGAHVNAEKDKHRRRLMHGHRRAHTDTMAYQKPWKPWVNTNLLVSITSSYFIKSIVSLLCSYLIHLQCN